MSALQLSFRVAFKTAPDQPSVLLDLGRHSRLYPVRSEAIDQLPSRLVDFIRLGMAVHSADGLIPRTGATSGYRSPCLELEVLDASFWNTPAVSAAVKACLDFVSGGDNWHVAFAQSRCARFGHQARLPFYENAIVALYSGGLDSAAGLAARLRESRRDSFIPLTVRHQFANGQRVKRQLWLLEEHFALRPGELIPLSVAAFLRSRRLQREFGLSTRGSGHRCRSFLFMTIAAVVAALEGTRTVELYESGVGAINAPFLPHMAGWRTTRNTHPHYLRLLSELATSVLDRPITYELPFFDRTKVEMVRFLVENGLEELARMSVSCIMHPFRRGNVKQCGTCAACVYRRYALRLAGVRESPEAYWHDLFANPGSFNSIPARRLRGLKMFLAQFIELAGLGSDGLSDAIRRHLVDTRVVETDRDMQRCCDLFRRYRDEWSELVLIGQSLGWPWANWLSQVTPTKQEVSRASA